MARIEPDLPPIAIKWRVSDCSQGYGIEDERHSQHAANRPAQEPNRLPLVHDDSSPEMPVECCLQSKTAVGAKGSGASRFYLPGGSMVKPTLRVT